MSGRSQLNGLRQLEAKIRGLPNQDGLRIRRQLFRNAQVETRARRAELILALEQVKALRSIQASPDLLVESEQKRLSAARIRARELLDLVREVNPDSAKLSEKLDAIKRNAKALLEEVKTKWVKACEDHQDRANALRPLAEHLSPGLVQRIQALDRLMRLGTPSPPTSAEAVQSIVDARTAFAAEIASLALGGPIEAFLRDAQAGNGDPKALLDTRVREYLDAHPVLWKSLRVVLN